MTPNRPDRAQTPTRPLRGAPPRRSAPGQERRDARHAAESGPSGWKATSPSLPWGKRLTRACPDCGADMILRPSRFGPFYGCEKFPTCMATHGAHKATGEPLGVPAGAETKKARMAAHAAFDPVWREYGAGRKQSYRWLAGKLGINSGTCHIGGFDKEMCGKVLVVMEAYPPEKAAAEIKGVLL